MRKLRVTGSFWVTPSVVGDLNDAAEEFTESLALGLRFRTSESKSELLSQQLRTNP